MLPSTECYHTRFSAKGTLFILISSESELWFHQGLKEKPTSWYYIGFDDLSLLLNEKVVYLYDNKKNSLFIK